MATSDNFQQAVKENRMVSVQEATIRKAVGFTIFGLTTLRLSLKGVAGMSGTALSFLYAVAVTFLITGFYNQCGCSLRLRWAIHEKGRPFKDRSFTPPEHMKFIRGKRQGTLMNFAFSNFFAVSLGVILYITQGIMSQQRFNALILGSCIHLGVMFFLSHRS